MLGQRGSQWEHLERCGRKDGLLQQESCSWWKPVLLYSAASAFLSGCERGERAFGKSEMGCIPGWLIVHVVSFSPVQLFCQSIGTDFKERSRSSRRTSRCFWRSKSPTAHDICYSIVQHKEIKIRCPISRVHKGLLRGCLIAVTFAHGGFKSKERRTAESEPVKRITDAFPYSTARPDVLCHFASNRNVQNRIQLSLSSSPNRSHVTQLAGP